MAAFAGVEDADLDDEAEEPEDVDDEELLLESEDDAEASVFAGAESLLDSPELSLAVFDPLRLSVR